MATVDPKIVENLRKGLRDEYGIELPENLDEFNAGLIDFWNKLPATERELLDLEWRAKEARENFTVEGFRHFFWCIWRREVAPYTTRWIKAFMAREWVILECFRGSTKSTTLTITFSAFVLGHFPHESVLIVQANDTAANKSSDAISNIIENFSGWKKCFPNVTPDKDRGWGANGYFVKDERVVKEQGYGAWVEKAMRDHTKDPSFVGAGITSADIVGMHPKWLFFDDIHNRDNSTFPKDRENVIATVQENVVPVITKPGGEKPFFGVACTFWDESDAYHILLETGLFKHIKTPIFQYVEEGGDAEFEGKKIKLAWPLGFPLESVLLYFKSNDRVTFKREYLCDETSEIDRLFKYQAHKASEIDLNWMSALGADPVGVLNAGEGISHFAVLEGLLSPYNYLIVVDGMLEKCGALAGEEYIVNAQGRYPNFQKAVIEGDGGGAIFAGTVSRHPGLIVQTVLVKDIGKGAKLDRQYKFLEPLARSGALRVSDSDTPILRAVRKYFDKFGSFDKSDPLADLGDALVLLAYAFPVIWARTVTSIPSVASLMRVKARPRVDVGNYHYSGSRR